MPAKKLRKEDRECAGAQRKKVAVDDQGAGRVKRASAIGATSHATSTSHTRGTGITAVHRRSPVFTGGPRQTSQAKGDIH